MSRLNRIAVGGAMFIVGATSTAAFAAESSYRVQRIPMGPRPDHYVIIRTSTVVRHAEQPYALTGSAATERRASARPTPSHPKGTHGAY